MTSDAQKALEAFEKCETAKAYMSVETKGLIRTALEKADKVNKAKRLMTNAETLMENANANYNDLKDKVDGLVAALEYARRYLNDKDHDTEYIDKILSKYRNEG